MLDAYLRWLVIYIIWFTWHHVKPWRTLCIHRGAYENHRKQYVFIGIPIFRWPYVFIGMGGVLGKITKMCEVRRQADGAVAEPGDAIRIRVATVGE